MGERFSFTVKCQYEFHYVGKRPPILHRWKLRNSTRPTYPLIVQSGNPLHLSLWGAMASYSTQQRVERLLDQIKTSENSGDWQDVHDRALDVLRIDRANLEALDNLESALRRLGIADFKIGQ